MQKKKILKKFFEVENARVKFCIFDDFCFSEKREVHFATFSAATHPMRVFPNSA